MKRKLFLAALSILLLPAMFADSRHDQSPLVTQSGIAFAGHTVGGTWCQCGCFACICDEGEEMAVCGQSSQAVSDEAGATGPVASPADPSLDFGSGALFVALALFALTRFRLNLF